MKSYFESSRYLNWLSRYKNSGLSTVIKGARRLWMACWLIFFSWKRVLNTSRNRILSIIISFFLEIVSVACLEFGERCDEDRNSDRLKNVVFFARRYLGNQKSCGDKPKNILKRQFPRLQWSFVHCSNVIIFKVVTIQIFF